MATHATHRLDKELARDEVIVESLVIPFAVIVLDVLCHGAAEVPRPDRNQPIQALFLIDRTKRSAYALALGARGLGSVLGHYGELDRARRHYATAESLQEAITPVIQKEEEKAQHRPFVLRIVQPGR